MYQACKSFSEQAVCVAALADRCAVLKRSFGYSAPDARTVAFENIISIARSAQMILNLLDSWVIGDEMVRQAIPQLLGLQTVTTDGVKMAGDMLNQSARLGFAVLGQFQVENALRNVGRELRLPSGGTGFYRTAQTVLTAVGLPSDRLQVLNVPARIRNSLHANGIHHRQHPSEASKVLVNGVTYEFIDGRPITCAAWEHIAHALEASVGVLEEVFLSHQVRAVTDPMMDQYAWEQETTPAIAG